MRLTASAGLFALTILVSANISSVQAQSLDISNINTEKSIVVALETSQKEETSDTTVKDTKPTETVHTVAEGETLIKIAEKYEVTWKRIYDKNINLVNPDIIKPNENLVIPKAGENIPERQLPEETASYSMQTSGQRSSPVKRQSDAKPVSTYQHRGKSSGNTYSPGYCTWYAKNKRPDLPNNLGNANTWVSRASAQGLATGSAPRVGAVGQQGMHVVYVERVNPGNTVTVSEMNYNGLYVVSSRTVPASTFHYIY